VPGDTQRGLRVSNAYDEQSYKHVLLPVWIAAFRYKDDIFRFLVNGQTGRVSGHAPYSFVKIAAFVALCVAVVVVLFMLWQGRNPGI
jgi:hypothetical protein